jgi:hypothetical protein
MTYNETVRDTYFRAANSLYAAGAAGSEEDAAGYLKHGKILENLGHEHWVATRRQETTLYKLRSRCEANTTEGREMARRVRETLTKGAS